MRERGAEGRDIRLRLAAEARYLDGEPEMLLGEV